MGAAFFGEPTTNEPMEQNTRKEEYLLQGDTVVRRTVFEEEVQGIDQLLSEAFEPVRHSFIGAPFPPMLRRIVKNHIFGNTPKDDYLLCFSEISHFPLTGAGLVKEDGTWHLSPDCARAENRRTGPNCKGPVDVEWQIPSDHRAFILLPIHINQKNLDYPYIFFTNPQGGCPMIPKLPNIMDSGRICTGNSYRDIRTDQEILVMLKKAMDALVAAPTNQDQRFNDEEFLRFDDEENTIPLPMETRHFHGPISDVRILAFCDWLERKRL